jgi:hypothetical protein
MRRAAAAATVGFAALATFQAALALGAGLGEAAWGGSHAHLPPGQRVASGVAAAFYVAAIFVVRGRAAGRAERRYRRGTWALVVVFGLSGLANLASGSRWESELMAPAALVLAALCLVVARAQSASGSARASGRTASRA